MMRSMRNKVVQASQTVAREAQDSAQSFVGDVAEEVLQRTKTKTRRRSYPPVSNKRKPARVPSQSRSRSRKKRRAAPYDVFEATS